ncbi:phenylalanine--tRNA ligase subunit beta [uncultured Sharpea sp.]|uniref:phenylalanine--tRNA ligase subunit beta n=1 Tax=uncultured Sharpea sp. TaxID=1112738 RepID=UPI0025851E8F|nr:phenylalanine--tRNA ligase subunit beta [uncultured Sharpea sp.]
MLASYKLLNQYVKVDDQNPEELAEKITRIGHEVEGHYPLALGTKLVVGYVKECIDHPDSDHLHICQVEVAPGEVTQIVCGAPNVAAGEKVIVALPGCELHAGKISAGKIRGAESNGMICSIAELIEDQRLLREEDKAGIHVLDQDAPVGVEALSYLGLDDFIMDIGLTPNRSDCMAMTSLAHEVAALLNREVTYPEVKKYDEKESEIEVHVETNLCPFFGAKLVKGVSTHESPAWLKNYLLASGIKPINNIVDISNFVMVETGQPIHMYDYDKLVKKAFTIKTGFDTEETMLDGESYKIEPSDIIVSTDDGIGCIAGVMGAESTKIDDTTTNIVIEAATFDGATLRATARRLNLLTDASQHYIKGAIDTANSLHVLDRCADLLVQLADAKEVYKSVHTPLSIEPKVVETSVARTNGLLGTSFTAQEIADVFDRLHFSYESDGENFKVTIPTYRNDISMDADLTEEVARLYGYDNLPNTLPFMSMTEGILSDKQAKEKMIRKTLADLGLHEVLTYTLTSTETVNDFNLFHDNEETVALMSPLNEERAVVRKSLLPALLSTIKYNLDHSNKDVNIFELANTYSRQDKEISNLAIACTGHYVDIPWLNESKPVDFYLVKGFVETLFDKLGISNKRYTFTKVERENKDFHPGRSGYIRFGKKIVGVIGEVHPAKAKAYGVGEVYVAELNLTEILNLRTSALKFTAIPTYPEVSRDLALVVDATTPAQDILTTILKSAKILVDAKIFDVYEGEHVEEGKKSIAISLRFQDPAKTLDEESITKAMHAILERVKKEFNAVIRQ